jgi:hypothetical protein
MAAVLVILDRPPLFFLLLYTWVSGDGVGKRSRRPWAPPSKVRRSSIGALLNVILCANVKKFTSNIKAEDAVAQKTAKG